MPQLRPVPGERSPSPQPTLYFAFGSNLSLAQMAARCPQSLYVGRATLPGHRWHINTRGYANVVRDPGASVQGLVYQIEDADEARLDRSEGVAKGCYSKARRAVDLYPACGALYRRPVAWIVDKGGAEAVLAEAVRDGRNAKEIGRIPGVEALVYIDTLRVKAGEPREEYVGRINVGVRDAIALGVDPEYVGSVVRPFVPAKASDPAGPKVAVGKRRRGQGGAAVAR